MKTNLQHCAGKIFSWLILLGLSPLCLKAQNEHVKWYFGQGAGLDFLTSPPTPTISSLSSTEGSASIADAAGGLLFYTNGTTVYNWQNAIMANGTGLLGNQSTVQSSLIVKKPGAATLYYIFTLAPQGQSAGLQYSMVDMSLAAGMGSVTTKNVPLYTPSAEMLSGVQHCNGTDFWVMSHQYNNNSFAAYLVTASGVSSTPVISATGSTVGATAQGGLKFSPNGRKMGMTTFNSVPLVAELFDFDPATGVVSNSLSLMYNQGNLYGREFSPDGTKFYVSMYTQPGSVYQWNLCAGSPSAIQASSLAVASSTAALAGLQTGPDGKIYCTRWGTSELGIINSPNTTGPGCNYIDAGLLVPNSTIQFGLPNFVCNLFKPVNTYTIQSQLSCNTAVFNVSLPPNVSLGCGASSVPATSYLWDFGEPAAGAGNTSTLSSPMHSYGATGSYTVKVKQNINCSVETSTLVLQVTALPTVTVTVSASPTICAGQSATLSASGASSYTWNSTTVGPSITVAPLTTTNYSVAGGGGSCQDHKTITVNVMPAPSLSVTGTFSICTGRQTTITSSGANSYTWASGSTSSSIVVSPTVTTGYTVTGTSTLNACTSVKTVSVMVYRCTGIEALTSQGHVGFYPNPFTDRLTIDLIYPAEIFIYNQLGDLVYTGSLQKGQNNLDLGVLRAGVYFARVIAGQETGSLRLLKTE